MLLRAVKCRRPFFSSRRQVDITFFDTYKFVTKLESSGFSRDQSEAIMSTVLQILHDKSNRLKEEMLLYRDFEEIKTSSKMDLNSLKNDLQLFERNEFAKLKLETEVLLSDVEKLAQKCREDINRLYASQRLELNLERGKIFDERADLHGKLQEFEAKMEQEMNTVKAPLQQITMDTLRTLLGTASTIGLVILGYMRLFK